MTGTWLLDSRLRHRKLEIEVNGTKHGKIFRKGRFEGSQGYTVVTETIRDASKDIYVRIDSTDPTPMTRIPLRFLRPKSSTFYPGLRVVIKGQTVDGQELYIGSYGFVGVSEYELEYDVRLIYVLPSGPYAYFALSSLCPSGDKVEWLGYVY